MLTHMHGPYRLYEGLDSDLVLRYLAIAIYLTGYGATVITRFDCMVMLSPHDLLRSPHANRGV